MLFEAGQEVDFALLPVAAARRMAEHPEAAVVLGRGFRLLVDKCDCHIKSLLVTLLAWQAKAADPDVDTWRGGRFLERWADSSALQDLRHADAGYV